MVLLSILPVYQAAWLKSSEGCLKGENLDPNHAHEKSESPIQGASKVTRLVASPNYSNIEDSGGDRGGVHFSHRIAGHTLLVFLGCPKGYEKEGSPLDLTLFGQKGGSS